MDTTYIKNIVVVVTAIEKAIAKKFKAVEKYVIRNIFRWKRHSRETRGNALEKVACPMLSGITITARTPPERGT